jgi:beta-glucuronidase
MYIGETPLSYAVGLHLNFRAVSFGAAKPRETWKEIRTFKHHKDIIREYIETDKNHPCVVMWSIVNEAATAKGTYFLIELLVLNIWVYNGTKSIECMM